MHAFLLTLFVYLSASSAFAQLNPAAKYFIGEVKVHLSGTAPCYVENAFSGDMTQTTVRTVTALEHLSPEQEIIWAAAGPYTANLLNGRNLYRYQDPTPGALIKDLVLNMNGTMPTKLSLLYWHAEAAHHDPVRCDNLVEATTAEQLQHIADVFANF